MSAHELWPEFDDISNDFMERLSERDFYNYAKVRIDACAVLQQELDAARLEIDRLRLALEELACLGNGDKYGNSIGNEIAIKALAAQQGKV